MGMGELEVLAVAGDPEQMLEASRWVYHRDDGYLIELTFKGGRLIRIDDAKLAS
jgi:hypothetical protein